MDGNVNLRIGRRCGGSWQSKNLGTQMPTELKQNALASTLYTSVLVTSVCLQVLLQKGQSTGCVPRMLSSVSPDSFNMSASSLHRRTSASPFCANEPMTHGTTIGSTQPHLYGSCTSENAHFRCANRLTVHTAAADFSCGRHATCGYMRPVQRRGRRLCLCSGVSVVPSSS